MELQALAQLAYVLGGAIAGGLITTRAAMRKQEQTEKHCELKFTRLSQRYEDLLDRHDSALLKMSDKRAEIHDLRGELMAFKTTLREGGRRLLDPPFRRVGT